MNILYRPLEELSTNEKDLEKRLTFYQLHYYDNLYNVADDGEYLGFLNYQTEIKGREIDIQPIQYGCSNTFVYEWFKNHPGIHRVPVVMNKMLIGEYYNADMTGRLLYKEIEDRALELFPIFQTEISEWLKNQTIGIIGDGVSYIQSVLSTAEYFTPSKKYDLVIDTAIIPQFRSIINRNGLCIKSPSEILLPILISKIIRYFKKYNVNFLVINGIMKKSMYNVTNQEKERLKMTLEEVLQDTDFLRRFCDNDIISFNKLLQHKYDLGQFVKIISNGVSNVLIDKSEENYNIVNGRRFTTDVPSSVSSRIHIFGPCAVMGLCVADEMTICSILQKFINQDGLNTEVFNHGLAYGKDLLNDLLGIIDEPICKGDSIIWFSAFENKELSLFTNHDIPIIEVKDCVKGLTDWFLDNPFHCNAKANTEIAKNIFSYIKQHSNNISTYKRISIINSLGIELYHDPFAILNSIELNNYIKYLEQFQCNDLTKKKGAIVINANPCTLGHLYLVREALKQVDYLYVFLVEESKGSLPYLDREYMLKESLKYNRRVCVIRGGDIMTSEKVFPEYFNKSIEPSRISLALTHRVFGRVANSILGVTCRFFGTEPNDILTQSLNDAAYEILPEYGIIPIVINRLSIDNIHVSAKDVRRHFYNKEYAKLAKLVTLSTYIRLLEIAKDYNDDNLMLYYQNAEYSILKEIHGYNSNSLVFDETKIRINSSIYPGQFEKYGCDYRDQRWILKIAHDECQNLSLAAETFGQLLCQQMDIITSEILPIEYHGTKAQLAKNWMENNGSQFFPLAAYYEELIDHTGFEHGVTFKYSIFKQILKSKCPEEYDKTLTIFWRIMVVDYLLCNARSAGNIGFINNGKTVKLSPIYDNSTELTSISDIRFLSSDFPCLLMKFDLIQNSAYFVLNTFNDRYKYDAINYAKDHLDLSLLYESVKSAEECFLFDVVEHRYLKLFK